ncbi:MAG: glycine cleavage system protein H [Acidobacteria bacterium]|nr:glycine cleavage system protein H [Acidobacteriota bacterium]
MARVPPPGTPGRAEYAIAVVFLLLFVPFWRFVNGTAVPALARQPAPASRRVAPRLVEWFAVPEGLYFHPGHAWARVEENGEVTVGLDDFASKLVGPLAGIRFPAAGARVGQGEPGWTLVADDQAVDMLSPIDGTVVETNPHAFAPQRPSDPYGRDWLLRLKPDRLGANVKTLLANGTTRAWMALAADALRARLSSPGLVYQDGGVLIDGVARTLEPEKWADIAREFLLTSRGDDTLIQRSDRSCGDEHPPAA